MKTSIIIKTFMLHVIEMCKHITTNVGDIFLKIYDLYQVHHL